MQQCLVVRHLLSLRGVHPKQRQITVQGSGLTISRKGNVRHLLAEAKREQVSKKTGFTRSHSTGAY